MIKIEYLDEEIPVYDITVEDNHNFYANDILVHNCTEIFIPSISSEYLSDKIIKDYSTNEMKMIKEYVPGEIALCNLSAINITEYAQLSQEERYKLLYNIAKAADNMIDYAYYPVPEGEHSNKKYRTFGLGIINMAQYLASKGVKFSDKEAIPVSTEITEDVYYNFYNALVDLAIERGPFEGIKYTKWQEGWLPIDFYKDKDNYNLLKKDWEALRERIKANGIRFAVSGAQAPNATSALILKATEGTLPLKQLVATKTGTYSYKQLAPNLNKYRAFYETSWEIPNKVHMDLAVARQMFIDQGQSLDSFYIDESSAAKIVQDIIYAERIGLKSLYYLNSQKAGSITEHETCESCSS